MNNEIQTVPQIPGLLIFSLDTKLDERGYFQEKYHHQKMANLGLPSSFQPVQQNISYNKKKGVTRGLHAETWDKYIAIIKGEVFCAFLDLRPRASYGNVFTIKLNETKSLFLPKGVANSYQTLVDDVYYSYLVNAHWSPDAQYTSVNMADPSLKIDWPISLDQAIISDKDKHNLYFQDLK